MADFLRIHSQKSAHVMNARQVCGTRVYAFGHFPIVHVCEVFATVRVCVCRLSRLSTKRANIFMRQTHFLLLFGFFRLNFHFRIDTGAQSNRRTHTRARAPKGKHSQ